MPDSSVGVRPYDQQQKPAKAHLLQCTYCRSGTSVLRVLSRHLIGARQVRFKPSVQDAGGSRTPGFKIFH
jgi:hypothetical protein